jgi:hypothetical protein
MIGNVQIASLSGALRIEIGALLLFRISPNERRQTGIPRARQRPAS